MRCIRSFETNFTDGKMRLISEFFEDLCKTTVLLFKIHINSLDGQLWITLIKWTLSHQTDSNESLGCQIATVKGL